MGAAAIAFGGDLTVDAASRIAIDLGMSQTLVGLTIVSIGTSLPELVTSVVAARKNEVDMAVGNAVGSNIFNILMVLGISSAISPVALIREKHNRYSASYGIFGYGLDLLQEPGKKLSAKRVL